MDFRPFGPLSDLGFCRYLYGPLGVRAIRIHVDKLVTTPKPFLWLRTISTRLLQIFESFCLNCWYFFEMFRVHVHSSKIVYRHCFFFLLKCFFYFSTIKICRAKCTKNLQLCREKILQIYSEQKWKVKIIFAAVLAFIFAEVSPKTFVLEQA